MPAHFQMEKMAILNKLAIKSTNKQKQRQQPINNFMWLKELNRTTFGDFGDELFHLHILHGCTEIRILSSSVDVSYESREIK